MYDMIKHMIYNTIYYTWYVVCADGRLYDTVPVGHNPLSSMTSIDSQFGYGTYMPPSALSSFQTSDFQSQRPVQKFCKYPVTICTAYF